MCASWLPANVLPGSSGNVLLTSLAAGITLTMARYSWLGGLVCVLLTLSSALREKSPYGLVRKGGNSEGIGMLDKPGTIQFSSLSKYVSLTQFYLQLHFDLRQ